MQQQQQRNYKVVLVGGAEVGKTTLVRKLLSEGFRFGEGYIPTLGVEVCPIRFHTSMGSVSITLWDTAGNPRFRGLGPGYYVAADACIGMHDLTNPDSLQEMDDLVESVREEAGDIPVVIIRNKADLVEAHATSVKEDGIDDLRAIFLPLLCSLTGVEDLELV